MNKQSLPALKKKALELFAELVKLEAFQDGRMRCYTCSNPLELHTSNCQLGHYLSRGAYPGLTFHRDNSRLQDIRCNVWLHGNTIEFRERLIAEIGVKRVQELEAMRHVSVKLSKTDYLDMIETYKQKIAELIH